MVIQSEVTGDHKLCTSHAKQNWPIDKISKPSGAHQSTLRSSPILENRLGHAEEFRSKEQLHAICRLKSTETEKNISNKNDQNAFLHTQCCSRGHFCPQGQVPPVVSGPP